MHLLWGAISVNLNKLPFKANSALFQNTFFSGPRFYSLLPRNVKDYTSIVSFNESLNRWLWLYLMLNWKIFYGDTVKHVKYSVGDISVPFNLFNLVPELLCLAALLTLLLFLSLLILSPIIVLFGCLLCWLCLIIYCYLFVLCFV